MFHGAAWEMSPDRGVGEANGALPVQPSAAAPAPYTDHEGERMLWVLAIILVIVWLVGVIIGQTLGGFLHLLLVLAALAVGTELALRFRRERREQSGGRVIEPQTKSGDRVVGRSSNRAIK